MDIHKKSLCFDLIFFFKSFREKNHMGVFYNTEKKYPHDIDYSIFDICILKIPFLLKLKHSR